MKLSAFYRNIPIYSKGNLFIVTTSQGNYSSIKLTDIYEFIDKHSWLEERDNDTL